VNKAQWITIGIGVLIVAALFLFGRTGPYKSGISKNFQSTPQSELSADSILFHAKEILNPAQIQWMNDLEQSVIRGDVKKQKLDVFHQLAHFWKDSARIFEPYAWYEAEAARLENSEKSLTFAAHLLLDDMMSSPDVSMQRWLATQAKELFDKALIMNPADDSSKIGVGVCYMFGNISDNPMQGILAIREIADKNPDNLYAQMMLGLGGIQSGQYDKAAERFLAVIEKQPNNIEAVLNLADVYERLGNKAEAVKWYKRALTLIQIPEAKKEIEERIKSLQ